MNVSDALSVKWIKWVQSVQSAYSEGLVPLFLLHCKRGQSWVPIASFAATLNAAGLLGINATKVAKILAAACPELIILKEATDGEQPCISLRVSSSDIARTKDSGNTTRRPAMCAGVVAKGFSLALPPCGDSAPGSTFSDAQGKRWQNAQSSFYADIKVVENEFLQKKASVFSQIVALAKKYSADGVSADLSFGDAPSAATPTPMHASLDAERMETDTGDAASSSLLYFLTELTEHTQYKDQICHIEEYRPKPAEYATFETLLDSKGQPLLSVPTVAALQKQLGIERLFVHQRAALAAVMGKKNHLCITTGTSSGKSLAFALPILEEFRRDCNMRALILFPTKALAQDQLGKLQTLFRAVCPDLRVCTFDGDTPKMDRTGLLKTCHVFLTNPDMLHYTILPANKTWRHVLENLRYVVLDEAHVYRATFGTHIALLLRRFRRVLDHYNSSPLFIACSATIVNAAEFFMQLVGFPGNSEIEVVDSDTAGRGERKFALWNPPVLDADELDAAAKRREANSKKRARFSEREGSGAASRLPPGVGYRTRSSSFTEAAWLLAEAVRRKHRTVCFLQVRSMVEIVLQATQGFLDDRPELRTSVAAYRGGYSATDRRRLERRLFDGDLIGVVATNALELGIDIGDLDVTIHVGVPPTVASVWQQAGRAGRRGRPSVAILVAHDAPLEQHFCRQPSEFFKRTLEARLPDVGNQFLLRGHVVCAAVELQTLTADEASKWFGEAVSVALEDCKRDGKLMANVQRHDERSMEILRHFQGRGKKSPKEEVSLRDIDPIQFKVLERGSTVPLETLDQKLAFMKLHPGAIYLNQLRTFFVEELDLEGCIAWVVPRDPKSVSFYTSCREHSQIKIVGGGMTRDLELACSPSVPTVLRCGPVVHCWRMYGFHKKSKEDHRILDSIELSLPSVEYPTQAIWMDLPGAVLQPVSKSGRSVDRGGLHALEHAMLSLAPLCCDLESSELSCQHTRRDTDPNRYFLLLFETQKGGAGTATKVYERWESLLQQAVRLIEACPCQEGCPNCIVAPHCGEHNNGLDKVAALMIGHALGLCSMPTFAMESQIESTNLVDSCGACEEVPKDLHTPSPAGKRGEAPASIEKGSNALHCCSSLGKVVRKRVFSRQLKTNASTDGASIDLD